MSTAVDALGRTVEACPHGLLFKHCISCLIVRRALACERMVVWYRQNRRRHKLRTALWQRRNKVRAAAGRLAWSRRNPQKLRSYHLRRHYGLSLEDFEALRRHQRGCCAACRRKCAKLQVDHCHRTQQVRGLLCWPCNILAGVAKDSPARLTAVARYLKRRKT